MLRLGRSRKLKALCLNLISCVSTVVLGTYLMLEILPSVKNVKNYTLQKKCKLTLHCGPSTVSQVYLVFHSSVKDPTLQNLTHRTMNTVHDENTTEAPL